MAIDRVILVVMDSVGCGELPDAERYGDTGSNTIANIAKTVGGVDLPVLQQLGLGNLTAIEGMPPVAATDGAYGKCAQLSTGKDTSTGHWEMAGLKIDAAFRVYPDGFPEAIIAPFRERTGRDVLGNKPASGTVIIEELADQHMQTGALIVYTSSDSVFQIAAHEDVVPLDELYKACEIARDILDDHNVLRVIARPFIGKPGAFERTYNRKDYAVPPPGVTVLETLAAGGKQVVGVGKISDIYCGKGITRSVKSRGNRDGMLHVMSLMDEVDSGLVFINLVDFDSKYGHRRNPTGYYGCLQEFDGQLGELKHKVRAERDLLILTADHGNDPTMPGTDHTREYVPLLAFGPDKAAGVDLGIRKTFADVGATIADVFDVTPPAYGTSILPAIT